jgi:hypothetical protein
MGAFRETWSVPIRRNDGLRPTAATPRDGAASDEADKADPEVLRELPQDARDVTAAAADGVDSALVTSAAYTSDPGAASVGRAESGESLDIDGKGAGASFVRGGESRSVSATGGLSTGGVWGEVAVGGDKSGTSVGAYWEPGWYDASVGHSWATHDGGVMNAGGGAFWYPEGGGVSGWLKHTGADGLTRKLGAYVSVNADRAIKDLGPVDGADGQRRVELERSNAVNGGITPGLAGEVLGIGARLTVSKGRSLVYRTVVDENDARTLLTEEGGVVGYARDKARALGLKEDPLAVPDLSAPDDIKVGDELVVTVSGKINTGLFLGGLPVRVGAQGSLRGDFELAVKKRDEHHVELVVTPVKVRGLQARVGSPWVLDFDASTTGARAMRQGFVFDLRDPDAAAAYQRALDGDLPGGIEAKPARKRPPASALKEAIDGETLPEGVTRTYVERVDLKRRAIGLSVGFGLWRRGGSFLGIGYHRTKTDEKVTHLEDGVVIDVATRGIEKRKDVLISGTETRGVWAQLARTTDFDANGKGVGRFRGLRLEARLSDTKVRGLELNDEVIDKLNEAFGLDLPHYKEDGAKGSREVKLERPLQAEHLATLAESDAPELERLRKYFAEATDDLGRAEAVQRFCAEKGIEGFGAIHRALGGGRAGLEVSTSSSLYDDPMAAASRLALEHSEPLSADATKKELTARFVEVDDTLAHLARALLHVATDPLLDDDARASMAEDLQAAQSLLVDINDVSHLGRTERKELIARLDRGWTTGRQHEIIARLEAAEPRLAGAR